MMPHARCKDHVLTRLETVHLSYNDWACCMVANMSFLLLIARVDDSAYLRFFVVFPLIASLSTIYASFWVDV